ncbi:Uncharacterised protein [Corynebacterium renale]|nr:Uncharacterised protein [Corynebacterium renale]
MGALIFEGAVKNKRKGNAPAGTSPFTADLSREATYFCAASKVSAIPFKISV